MSILNLVDGKSMVHVQTPVAASTGIQIPVWVGVVIIGLVIIAVGWYLKQRENNE